MLRRFLELNGFATVIINGGMEFTERVKALQEFKEEAQILVSTDAAGESLNMQFAHIVINYDVPFNPMMLEQRIGRVDRIGQLFPVKAFNMMLSNSADLRVYEIIENKLQNILEELGIDKTADVLDSAFSKEEIKNLYLESLLDPEKFGEKGDAFLVDIKQKLLQFKSTENLLPSTAATELSADTANAFRQSLIPDWLLQLTKLYLEIKGIPYQIAPEGLIFSEKKHLLAKHYVFTARASLDFPAAETLHMQHAFIQQIFEEFRFWPAYTDIPIVSIPGNDLPEGYFSLWHLAAKNAFEEKKEIIPLFFNLSFTCFYTTAESCWKKLLTLFDDYLTFALIYQKKINSGAMSVSLRKQVFIMLS